MNRQVAKSAKEKQELAAQGHAPNMRPERTSETGRLLVFDLLGALGVLAMKKVLP
jgi:hypothetical protein